MANLWNKGEIEQECHAKMLKGCIEILNRHKIKYFLSGSALLGYVRENDFIKWCPGIVLNVVFDDVKKKENILINDFIEAGFFIKRHFKKRSNWKIRIDKGKLNIEVTGYYKDGPTYCRTQGKKKKRIPAVYFDCLFIQGKIRGVKFNCPKKIFKYIIYMYGPNWRVPIKSSKPSSYKTAEFYS